MGIHLLFGIIREKAEEAVKYIGLDALSGKVIAIDAFIAIYQFLTSHAPLFDNEGNPTNHLLGLFQRTIKLLEHGIKPVWVFDGKPPEEKLRTNPAYEASHVIAVKETGLFGPVVLTVDMLRDMKTLLNYMGVPYVQAPSEAEAQCAALCKEGVASCVVSEDMDSLVFGGKKLIRGMCNKDGSLFQEIDLEKVLTGLQLTFDQFIDMCVLVGCDYTYRIRGVGPATAYKFIKEHGSIEKVAEFLRADTLTDLSSKYDYTIDDELMQINARKLFKSPKVLSSDSIKLEWKTPDVEKIIDFLVNQKGFKETRVKDSLRGFLGKENVTIQSHMVDYFKISKKISCPFEERKVKKKKVKNLQKQSHNVVYFSIAKNPAKIIKN